MASVPDNSKPLDEKGIKHLQKVVGILLYHAMAVNSPILPGVWPSFGNRGDSRRGYTTSLILCNLP